MHYKINRSLIPGIARIFIEYGWYNDQCPQNWTNQLEDIHYGLFYGKAKTFHEHMESILALREKDQKWGKLTPAFVRGIVFLLNAYSMNNNLYAIESMGDSPEFNVPVPGGNFFTSTQQGREALKRIRSYGKTNIAYDAVQEYGLDRLCKELQNAGIPKGTISVRYDTHEPMELRDSVMDKGNKHVKMSTWYAIMPLVILDDGMKKTNI